MFDEMKEVGRSDHSGAVVKKKSSSGCLIIKKKITDGVGGVKGFSNLASRNLFNSTKERKRPRVVRSDSEPSDELSEPYSQKVDKFHNDSVLNIWGFTEHRESETEKRVNDGLNVFEFDEYDRFHERRIRRDVNDDRHRLKLHWQRGDQKESGSGSSRRIDDKRRDFYLDNRSTILDAKSCRPTHCIKSRYEMEDDESHLPLSVLSEKYREASDEPIRLQGKNGVLKVMVNKHKHLGGSHQSYDHAEAEDWKESRPAVLNKKQLNVSHKSQDLREAVDRQGSRSEDANKKMVVMRSSLYSYLKRSGKPVASRSKGKGKLELTKPMLGTTSKETDDSDTSLPLKSSGMRHCSTAKMVKNEQTISPPNENVTPVKGKESKVRRGSGTEKQLLREKIRSMLLGAGWTIDYRPRRNRDYLDAVYINPTGTAYWSIIKAYEALQKEEEDHSKAGGDFTPLPVEILSKLTRQTRKKIEREMKKKRRDEGNSRKAKRDRVEVSAEDADSDRQEEKLGSYMKHGCKTTKSRLEEASQDSGDDSNDNSDRETAKQDRAAKTTIGLDFHSVQGRKSRKLGRCTLLVRSSDEGLNSENDRFVHFSGKRTLLSWLINSGTVQMSEKVQYMNRRKTRVMQEGWITKDGIHCGCCSKILTVLKFELHAGSKLRQPFPNIFVQSGQSLMQCQIDAWNQQGELERKGFHAVDVDGDDPSDDTCGLCGDGGDLICCDGCPSTFHQSCLDIQMLPQGDWHCPNCSCKYCEMASMNCTEASVRTESSVLMCCLCEKKYHESCSLEMDDKPIDPTDPNLSFCGQKCQELYSHLQKLLGVKHELDSGFSWSLIHRSDLLSNTSSIEFSQRVECNSKLAVALSVIDECFLPIVDRRSGINLIHNVVYNCGSNFSRLNYSGFFTAILERGDEMICAASIRIHGTQLAEMPFIGTRHIYRRQGMCRRLLSAIESVLSSLRIEKLIIPAIAEHMHTWTDVFGFNPLEESHKQEMRSMNMLVFPGTDMLQKPLVQQGTLVGNIISKKDKRSVEIEGNMPETEKSELNSSDVIEFCDKIATTDSGSQDRSVPLDDGCSVDASDVTLSINSVKEDILLPVLANKSDFVSGSNVLFDGDDTAMQNGEESTENFAHADAGYSDIRCKPEIQSVSLNAHSDSIVAKNAVQAGNETTDKIANAGSFSQVPLVHLHKPVSSCTCEPELELSYSKEEECAVQNGNVTTNTMTSDANSFQRQDPDVVVHDTDSSDDPLLAKESVSVDAQSGSNVEECVGQVSNVAIAKTTDASLFQPQVLSGPSSDIVSSYISFDSELQHSRKESVSVDALCVEEIALQNGIGTNLLPLRVPDVRSDGPCEPDLQLSGKESVSVDAHSDSKVVNIDVRNGSETTGKIADAIPLEAQVPNAPLNDAVSSYIPWEPELQLSGVESLPLDPHITANVAELCFDASPVIPEIGKPPVQFSTGKGAFLR